MKKAYLYLVIFSVIIISSLSSCNTDDLTQLSAIKLTPESGTSVVFIGNTFTFKVTADDLNETDLTASATFKVNGEPITGNSFVTDDEPKSYEIQAFYKELESDIITVSASDGYLKNVLIEDFTGTLCGWCPRVAHAIQEVKSQSNQIVAVAVHTNFATGDPFSFDGSEELKIAFDISGLPEGRINRTHIWTSPEPSNLDDVFSKTGYSPIGIAINSEVTQNNITASIAVNFISEVAKSDVKIVVYLLENELIHDQANYTTYFGGNGTISDFEHNDVLRAIYTDVFGDTIPDDNTDQTNYNAGETYTLTLSKAIPDSVSANEHLHLVAFIVNNSTNEVLNVRESEVGETQDFQTGE